LAKARHSVVKYIVSTSFFKNKFLLAELHCSYGSLQEVQQVAQRDRTSP